MVVVLRRAKFTASPASPAGCPRASLDSYDEIEPRLEKVALGPKAVEYTERSPTGSSSRHRDEATAERDRRLRANADRPATEAAAAEAR